MALDVVWTVERHQTNFDNINWYERVLRHKSVHFWLVEQTCGKYIANILVKYLEDNGTNMNWNQLKEDKK